MRLIFEVSTLERATPATVSRGGVLYLDTADVGWNPYVVSWIERRSVQSEKANLIIFFDKYVPPCLEAMTKRFKTVLPIPDICYVQTLCCLLECLLTPENTPPDSPNELYELYFVFCCVWAFGSGLALTSGADGRLEFSNWFLKHPGTDQRDSTDSVHDGPAHLEGAPHHAGGGEWMWKDVCHTVHSGSPGPGIHVSRGERALQLLHVLGHCPAGHGTSPREKSGQEFWTTRTEKNNLFHR
ncbi:dynein heavy chain 17, axonemal [Trichonephila inaurata madagascariensis]|uniref:Dynein heavy chain 17, axonemal n=1 Tax=Trichonephila inaurata madagascariensis TaxID=2747483 RepID=A0A8X6MF92_9ARAC|nr:dynein heavy chain 17, axonemal [Trichonephila inaurata madagascariensis]